MCLEVTKELKARFGAQHHEHQPGFVASGGMSVRTFGHPKLVKSRQVNFHDDFASTILGLGRGGDQNLAS